MEIQEEIMTEEKLIDLVLNGYKDKEKACLKFNKVECYQLK